MLSAMRLTLQVVAMANERKILLFIVEGPTEEAALGTVLSAGFSDAKVEFQVTRGDVTTSGPGENASDIKSKLGNIVGQFMGRIFKPSDFLRVIHLIDTDGTYIPDEAVQLLTEGTTTIYSGDGILTSNPQGILQRNHEKANAVNRLASIQTIHRGIPYSAVFFSSNLDHVLYNDANLSREEKMLKAKAFRRCYGKDYPAFVQFLRETECSCAQTHEETWRFIKEGLHSVQRYNNLRMHLDDTLRTIGDAL